MRRYGSGALLVAAFALAACNPQPPKKTAEPEASAAPSPTPSVLALKITGRGTAREPIRVFQQQGNRKQYELQASAYESHGSSGRLKASFQHVHVTFHSKDGTTMNADAPRATVSEVANTVTLDGGVHARNSTGMTLACDQLIYSRTTERIRGVGHVVITDPNGLRATGSRFDSDISLTHTTMQ
jgi:LPS export ABC transporter protein LptC